MESCEQKYIRTFYAPYTRLYPDQMSSVCIVVLDEDNLEISRRSEVFKDFVLYFTYSGILSILSMLSDYLVP